MESQLTETGVPRRVTDASGMWQVIHPFTERVEFQTSDALMAREVGREYDRRDPVTERWLIEEFYRVPAGGRQFAEWVTSPRVLPTLRRLRDSSGRYLWQPAMVPDSPDYLLGMPVVVDEATVGLSIRRR